MPCSTPSTVDLPRRGPGRATFVLSASVALALALGMSASPAHASTQGPVPGATVPPPTPSAVPPTPPAEASDAPIATEEQQARAEFERGQRQYDLARFDRAIGHYARAYELLPLPAFLFNIAQCHRQLGEYRKAAFFYRRYLDTAENPPNAVLARTLLKEVEGQAEPGPVAARVDGRGSLFRRPWFWVAAGVVAAGVAGGAVWATRPDPTTLGTVNGR